MALTIDFLLSYDRKTIAAELRRIASVTGKNSVSKRDLKIHGRVSESCVSEKFGSLRNANIKSGLQPGSRFKWSREQILKALMELWHKTNRDFGRSPMRPDLKAYGLPFNVMNVIRHFGSWRKALIAVSAHPAAKLPPPPPEPIRKKRRGHTIGVGRRMQVFKRDSFKCRICKQSGVPIEVDHIIPVSKGGSDLMDNLQTLCARCNRGKSNRML